MHLAYTIDNFFYSCAGLFQEFLFLKSARRFFESNQRHLLLASPLKLLASPHISQGRPFHSQHHAFREIWDRCSLGFFVRVNSKFLSLKIGTLNTSCLNYPLQHLHNPSLLTMMNLLVLSRWVLCKWCSILTRLRWILCTGNFIRTCAVNCLINSFFLPVRWMALNVSPQWVKRLLQCRAWRSF